MAAVTLWAFNYTIVKFGVSELQPLAFPVLRFGIGGLALLVILWLREGSLGIRRTDLPLVTLVGFLGITVSQIAYVYGLTYASASSNALVGSTAPIVTAVFATVVGVEQYGRWHWTAAAIGMAGVALVVLGNPSATTVSYSALGDGLALVSVICSCASVIPVLHLVQRYSVYRILTYEMLIGSAIMLPIAGPSLFAQDYSRVTPAGWGALAYNVLLAGIVANLLYFTAIKRIGPSKSAVFQYLQALLGVLFAVVLLREPVTLVQMLGGAVVIGGVTLSGSMRARVVRRSRI